MSQKVASLFAEITADISGLEKGLQTAKSGLKEADKQLMGASNSSANLGKSLMGLILPTVSVSGAFAAFASFLKSSINEASEAAKVDAKLGAVIKSTGGSAGMTTKAIDLLSTAKSKMTGIDDELIKNSAAVMLTFTQVGKNVFPDAMQAAMDMSAVMGGDLQGSVVMLGKALNVTKGDIAAANMGMTALRRNGVSFTAEQKEMAAQMVAVGDIAGYQRLILAELAKEFGGASQAMFQAGSRSEELKNSWNNYKEVVGAGLLPVVQKFNEVTSNVVDAVTESAQASIENGDAIEAAGKLYGWSAVQIGNAMRHTSSLTEAQQRQVDEYKRLMQYGAAWGSALAKQGEAAEQTQQDYALMLKGGHGITKMLSDFAQESVKVEEFYADKKNLRALYKADQEELRKQLDAGLITQRQYNQSIHDMQVAWENGSFAAKKQTQALTQLQAQQTQQASAFALNMMMQDEGFDTQKAYDFAAATGQITQEAAEQYKAFDKVKDAFNNSTLTAQQAALAVKSVSGDVKALNGLSVAAYIDIYIRTHGSMIDFGTVGAGTETTGTNRRHGGAIGFASGTSNVGMPGIYDIGEQGREKLVLRPDGSVAVVPHALAVEMDKYGIGAMGGFSVGTGDAGGVARQPSSAGGSRGDGGGGAPRSGAGGDDYIVPGSADPQGVYAESPASVADTSVAVRTAGESARALQVAIDAQVAAAREQSGLLGDILTTLENQSSKRDDRRNADAAAKKNI